MESRPSQANLDLDPMEQTDGKNRFYPGGVILVRENQFSYLSEVARNFFQKHFGSVDLASLIPSEVIRWIDSREGEGDGIALGELLTPGGKVQFRARVDQVSAPGMTAIEVEDTHRSLFPELLPIETIPAGIWILEKDPSSPWNYRTVRTNRFLRNLARRDSSDFQNKNPLDFIQSLEGPAIFEAGNTPVEAELALPDGMGIPIRIDSHVVGGNGEILLVVTDLTELKAGEAELRAMHDVLMETVEQLMESNHGLSQNFEKLEALSTTDELTGLNNRRKFQEFIAFEWVRAARSGNHISVIILDVDYFKQYNDTYGHNGGDECLQKVAKGLSSTVKRSTDLLARYGGEEFIVVLPDTPPEGVPVLAERLRAAVEGLHIEHKGSLVSPYVTVSMGGASIIPTEGKTDTDLVKLADRALYVAKESGRNQLHLLTDFSDSVSPSEL